MIRWTPISQIDGITIQTDHFDYELKGGEDGETPTVTLSIPYYEALRLIKEGAESMGLIDKQKQKLKKLMEFLLEVL